MVEKKIQEFKNGDKLAELAKRIKGKVVVLYGEPLVGKSVLVHYLSKYFEKPVLFKVDNNYDDEYKSINPNLKYLDTLSFEKLMYYLDKANSFDNDFIAIDSLTSLAAEVLSKGSLSPRDYNRLASMYDIVTFKASRLKPKTIVVVAHEKLVDFRTGEVGPRMNKVSLRNVDIVIRLYKDEQGNRKLKIEAERKPTVVEPRFEIE
jgi:hypothetical protein